LEENSSSPRAVALWQPLKNTFLIFQNNNYCDLWGLSQADGPRRSKFSAENYATPEITVIII
jgi:hypothetical protein